MYVVLTIENGMGHYNGPVMPGDVGRVTPAKTGSLRNHLLIIKTTYIFLGS